MKLSIIVVTWNNENFIEQALKSCIDPDATDYEVLVVHNASTDRTGELIQRAIRGKDELFRVIENEINEGLGEARNIGMSHAKGSYFAFLDGDDWFEPGAISKIIDALDRIGPELLIYNHQRVWENSDIRANALTNLLRLGDVTGQEARRKVLANLGVAWNKAYHRDLITRSGATFGKRLYEDIDWNFRCLLHSKTVFTLPDIFVNYRQRDGSILRSTDDRHFDAILQQRSVLEMLKREPELLNTYGSSIYRHSRSQLFHVFDSNIRLPKNSEGKYLKQLSALLQDWRNATGIERRDLKLAISSLGSPILYRSAMIANRIRKKASKFTNRVRRSRKTKAARILVYRYVFLFLPIKKNRVYCESFWGSRIDCNPKAIADGLRNHGNFDIFFGLKKKTKSNEGTYKSIKIESLYYFYILATSEYIVSNANVSGHIRKRPGTIHLQTFHGTPWKSMGFDLKKFNPREMNWQNFARRSARWDYAISSNPHSSEAWRKSHPFNYKILEVGYPRNDIFFNAPSETALKVKVALGIPEGKKVALYAPTFREEEKGKAAEFDRSKVNLGAISNSLGDEYVLLVRAHYFNTKATTGASIIDASNYPRTNELLTSVDLLITDYSSIMFDYANMCKPIVIYAYDYDQYRATRGSYFEMQEQPPGPIAFDQNALLAILETRAFEEPESIRRLAQFRKEFCPWDDGKATERVLKEVFDVTPKCETRPLN